MDKNNKNARYGMRKLAVGFVSCMLGLSMVFASVQGTVAKEEAKADKKTEVVEAAEKELTKEEQIKLAKEELKAYLDTIDESVIDNPAIKYEDEKVKDEIKAAIKRAKELLEDKDIDDAKLEEIKKIPFKKVNGKKQGLFREFTRKALVDFEVAGERDTENPHNKKKYVSLKDNKFTIKTSLKDLKKSGEDKKVYFKINYVTDEQYNDIKVDAMSSSTPKYNKQELHAGDYTLKAVDGGYEVEITKLPENTVLIKPIVIIELAKDTKFENGDIVFVKKANPEVKENKEEKKENVKEEKNEAKATFKFFIDKSEYVKTVDGKEETVQIDVAPFIQNDRTMLPLRYLAEAIGAEVKYEKETRTASFTKDGIVASIQIDGDKIKLSDGKEITMDSKPINKNGRIFVSLTNVSKVFNLTNGNSDDEMKQDIEWDKKERSVTVIAK